MMPREKPCSPGHCLGMFNDYMRTDMLRHVHQYIQARMDQRGKKSPLALLIESIEDPGVFEGRHLCVVLGRIPSIVINAIDGPAGLSPGDGVSP